MLQYPKILTTIKDKNIHWVKDKLNHCLSATKPGVRTDYSFTLKTQAQGRALNPDPGLLRAIIPGDQGATCLRFPGIGPPQAEAKNNDPNGEASQTKGIIAPNGGVIKAPNRGNKIPTISFMGLKSTLVANQEPSLEEGTGLWPNPMTIPLEQDK
ncbi:hypothetical protein DSO57_1021599 [Entomophthora muscae]|uniref:Uncharacterized protein n=1 Tax=Entomophthora muscae TaxID=34485 RepID=A0ACC2UCY2_9FUNG|nr:hypothetical protein DSO57_1021599 [Entomophthora muscae]